MSQTTGIAYVHHTRNFWSGCTKIGPGCDGCYAEAFNRWTRGKNPETGEAKNWGPYAPRIPHLAGARRDLFKWNGQAAEANERRRVFLNTNSDTFDNEVPQAWRDYMFASVEECPWLDCLLVTKRIGNVPAMVPEGWTRAGYPFNIRLIITITDQKEADRDIPKLLALPCKNGISYEPALGPVDWSCWLCDGMPTQEQIDSDRGAHYLRHGAPRLDWMIVGGESAQAGHPARPFDLGWARSTVAQCKVTGVPAFIKQLGRYPMPESNDLCGHRSKGHSFYRGSTLRYCDEDEHVSVDLKDRAGADPAEWPEDLRVREYPV